MLLDERRLEMLVPPRLYAGELLDLVTLHCQLKEKEYFGLAVVDESGHYTWLQLDRKALDHDLPRKPATATLTVHFLVPNLLRNAGILNNVMTSRMPGKVGLVRVCGEPVLPDNLPVHRFNFQSLDSTFTVILYFMGVQFFPRLRREEANRGLQPDPMCMRTEGNNAGRCRQMEKRFPSF